MKFFIVTLAVLLSAALAAGQFFGDYRSFGFRSLTPDFDFSGAPAGAFGGPSDFGGSAVVRDSRQDRGTGPVVFPASPANAPVESSGVVVGASGFGFVPPQAAQRSLNSNSIPVQFPRNRYY